MRSLWLVALTWALWLLGTVIARLVLRLRVLRFARETREHHAGPTFRGIVHASGCALRFPLARSGGILAVTRWVAPKRFDLRGAIATRSKAAEGLFIETADGRLHFDRPIVVLPGSTWRWAARCGEEGEHTAVTWLSDGDEVVVRAEGAAPGYRDSAMQDQPGLMRHGCQILVAATSTRIVVPRAALARHPIVLTVAALSLWPMCVSGADCTLERAARGDVRVTAGRTSDAGPAPRNEDARTALRLRTTPCWVSARSNR